jgi:arginine repressor
MAQEDGEKLVLLYGRWRDLPDHIRAELIASSYTDRTAADISRQLDKLRIGQTEKKGSRKRVTVGEEAESVSYQANLCVRGAVVIFDCLCRSNLWL